MTIAPSSLTALNDAALYTLAPAIFSKQPHPHPPTRSSANFASRSSMRRRWSTMFALRSSSSTLTMNEVSAAVPALACSVQQLWRVSSRNYGGWEMCPDGRQRSRTASPTRAQRRCDRRDGDPDGGHSGEPPPSPPPQRGGTNVGGWRRFRPIQQSSNVRSAAFSDPTARPRTRTGRSSGCARTCRKGGCAPRARAHGRAAPRRGRRRGGRCPSYSAPCSW